MKEEPDDDDDDDIVEVWKLSSWQALMQAHLKVWIEEMWIEETMMTGSTNRRPETGQRMQWVDEVELELDEEMVVVVVVVVVMVVLRLE